MWLKRSAEVVWSALLGATLALTAVGTEQTGPAATPMASDWRVVAIVVEDAAGARHVIPLAGTTPMPTATPTRPYPYPVGTATNTPVMPVPTNTPTSGYPVSTHTPVPPTPSNTPRQYPVATATYTPIPRYTDTPTPGPTKRPARS